MSPDNKTPADAEHELDDLEATESETADVKGGAFKPAGDMGWDVKANKKL